MYNLYKQQPLCGQVPPSPSGEAIWNLIEGKGTIFPVIGWTAIRGTAFYPIFLLFGFGWKLAFTCAAISTIADTLMVMTYILRHKYKCTRKG